MSAVKSAPFALRPSRSINPTVSPRERSRAPSAPPAPARVRAVESPPARRAEIPIEIDANVELKLRVVLRPMLGPPDGIDVTEALTRAVAQELWNLHGGNDVMNWLEAQRLLGEAFGFERAAHRNALRG